MTDETWAEVLHRLSVDDIYRGQALAVSVLYLDAMLADQKLADGQTVFTTDSWIELDEPQTDHAMPEPGQMISRIAQAGGSLFFVSVSCGEMYGRTVYVQSQQDMTEWMKNYDRQLARLRWGMLGLSLAAGGLLMLVVKWSLRSLTKVSGEIHEISEGNYGKKLEIKGSSEVAELASDVDVMSGKIAENMRQLSETSERQKQFIHNMAHEMKTPLTSIIGFSDILSIKERVTDKETDGF